MMYCGLQLERLDEAVEDVVEMEDGAGYLWRLPAEGFAEPKGCGALPGVWFDVCVERN